MKKSSRQPLERAVLHPMVVSDRVGEATLVASPDPAESGWDRCSPTVCADQGGAYRRLRWTNGGSEKLPGALTS